MVAHRNEEFRTDAVGRFERQRDRPRRQPVGPPVIDRLHGFSGTRLRTPAKPTPEPCDCGADRRLTHTPKHIGPTSGGAGSSENRGILHKSREKATPKLEKTLYDGASLPPALRQTDSTPGGLPRATSASLYRAQDAPTPGIGGFVACRLSGGESLPTIRPVSSKGTDREGSERTESESRVRRIEEMRPTTHDRRCT